MNKWAANCMILGGACTAQLPLCIFDTLDQQRIHTFLEPELLSWKRI